VGAARADFAGPGLGVGLVYWPTLAPLFADGADVVDVLELEPQSLWRKVSQAGTWRYEQDDRLLGQVRALPQPKLIHGVGQPVGGTVPDPVEHLALLRRTVRDMRPAWVSEHLSFNRVTGPHGAEQTGFLLPPRQSAAGVRVATANIDAFRAALNCPVAFETGTNYLRPREDEMPDGEFFGAVCAGADCGILLDLHNLWCNERNGRATIADVVGRLPLERVWEVHVAGGTVLAGYALDAHSGRVHPDLLDVLAGLLPRLPSLGALIFEILPDHLPATGLDEVARQLDQLRAVWTARPARRAELTVPARPSCARPGPDDEAEVAAWEGAVTAAIRGGAPDGRFGDLRADPGVPLYRELIGEFRRAAVMRCLGYTMTAMLLGLGGRQTRELLETCFRRQPPDVFAAVEADQVARFLESRPDVIGRIPHLAELLAFEHAVLRAALYGEATDVEWTADPAAIFAALGARRLPDGLPQTAGSMRVSATAATAPAWHE
jgi:uncharacterized protein (UPF0276 family)